MKLSLLQSELKKALATVATAVPNKATLPILSNVMLEATDDALRLTATNLEVSITTSISARVETTGAITLPFKLLKEAIDNYPNDVVSLELDEKTQTATLKCGKHRSQIRGIDADDFPNLPQHNSVEWFSLPLDNWRDLPQRVGIAASNEDTRPILQCVHIAYFGDRAQFEAADGFRAARLETRFDTPQSALVSTIVPKATFAALANAMSGETIMLSLTKDQNHAVFSDVTTVLTSRTIEGTFPEVDRVIQPHTSRAVFNTAELFKAIKLTSLFSQEVSKTAKAIKLQFSVDHVTISSNIAEIGENSSEVECLLSGDPITIALDCNRLMDAVNACKSQEVALEMIMPEKAVTMRPVGSDNYWHIVMPVSAH